MLGERKLDPMKNFHVSKMCGSYH